MIAQEGFCHGEERSEGAISETREIATPFGLAMTT
jgi:hypothetical protein